MTTTPTTTDGDAPATLFALDDLTTALTRVPLEQIDLERNPRQEIDPDGIDRLALMLATTGQLTPGIGLRASDRFKLYDGQRRLLAARRSHELELPDGARPIQELLVLSLSREPTPSELRRLQAQANQHEQLSLNDQRQLFADCWAERSGLDEDRRLAAVCCDLGISAQLAHNLRRQLELAAPIRDRVSRRPKDAELSVTLANELHEIATTSPRLAEAIAERVVDRTTHHEVLSDLAAAAHQAAAATPAGELFAVRADPGTLLTAEQLLTAIDGHVTPQRLGERGYRELTGLLAGMLQRHQLDVPRRKESLVERGLKHLRDRLAGTGATIRILQEHVDLMVHGRQATVIGDGEHAIVYLADPLQAVALLVDLDQEQHHRPLRERSAFAAAGPDGDAEATAAVEAQREERRARAAAQQQAAGRNLDLGRQLRDRLTLDSLSEPQRTALWRLIGTALMDRFGELAVHGAAHTDPTMRQPLPSGKGTQPLPGHAVRERLTAPLTGDQVDGEVVLQLAGRICAGALLDPDAVPLSGPLGRDRLQRRTSVLLPPAGTPDEQELPGTVRPALYRLAEPHLQPALEDLHRDVFSPRGDQGSWSPTSEPSELEVGDLDLSGIDLGD